MDYSKDRFIVFDAQDRLIGRIDEDEFVRSPGAGGKLLYRLDGSELYDMQGDFVGVVSAGQVLVEGKVMFRIEAE
jgi:hypothetical protein